MVELSLKNILSEPGSCAHKKAICVCKFQICICNYLGMLMVCRQQINFSSLNMHLLETKSSCRQTCCWKSILQLGEELIFNKILHFEKEVEIGSIRKQHTYLPGPKVCKGFLGVHIPCFRQISCTEREFLGIS